MLIKGEDRGGLRTAPDAREAEQMAWCTQLKLKQVWNIPVIVVEPCPDLSILT